MNLNALIVIINSKAWYWLILRNLKNGFVINVAVMKPIRSVFMNTFIPWRMNMRLDARVAEAQIETIYSCNY